MPQCQHPSQDPQDLQESQIPQPPAQPASHIQGQQVVHLNWSHFKPEFVGKPEEDAEAHLLRTNDWMAAHHFLQNIKVQRFLFVANGRG